jgi:hypothetical protein
MSEYGHLFSVPAAANAYYLLNFGFFAAYGLVAALVIPATSYFSIRERPLPMSDSAA